MECDIIREGEKTFKANKNEIYYKKEKKHARH